MDSPYEFFCDTVKWQIRERMQHGTAAYVTFRDILSNTQDVSWEVWSNYFFKMWKNTSLSSHHISYLSLLSKNVSEECFEMVIHHFDEWFEEHSLILILLF